MTRTQKWIIGILSVLTLGVLALVAVLVVNRLSAAAPGIVAIVTQPAPTAGATGVAFPTATATAQPTITLTTTRPPATVSPTPSPPPFPGEGPRGPATSAPTPTLAGIACPSWDMPHWFGFFDDKEGNTHFVGEARNNGNSAREGVFVVIRFFNKQGQFVGVAEATLMRDVILSGQSSPYHAVVEEPPLDWQSYSLEFRCSADDTRQKARYDGLEVTSHQGKVGPGSTYTITGEVKNTGKEAGTGVQVVAVLYDSNGWVVDALRVDADTRQLAPGATSTFKVAFDALEHPVATYNVDVEGQVER